MLYWIGLGLKNVETKKIDINTVSGTLKLQAYEWTTEPPKEEGWYWVYFPDYPGGFIVCVNVGFDTDGKPIDIGNIDDPWLLENATHFIGPLPVPEPPV